MHGFCVGLYFRALKIHSAQDKDVIAGPPPPGPGRFSLMSLLHYPNTAYLSVHCLLGRCDKHGCNQNLSLA